MIESQKDIYNYNITPKKMRYIDLRSDTVTQPTQQMRNSILTSHYGDHIYNQDRTVVELQKMAAQLFGKEAASFVPSGVFGNQCSVLTAGRPGTQIVVGEQSHMISYQNGSIGKISRMLTRTIECDSSFFIPVSCLKSLLKTATDQRGSSITVFAIQNPTSCGRIYPMQQFTELVRIAKQSKIHVHMDGARVFNACAELHIEPKELAKDVDSVMFCLSKGLCSPMGSVVVGTSQFIERFNKNRQILGGIFRKPGILAHMGMISLSSIRLQVEEDNSIARSLSKRLQGLGWIEIVSKVETNMIFFRITNPNYQPNELKKFVGEKNIKMVVNANREQCSRLVIHHYIREPQIQIIISAFQEFQQQFNGENVK